MKALRPVASWGAFDWVHIDRDGKPLCERPSDAALELRPEIVDESASLCPKCRHALNHYQVAVVQNGQVRSHGPSEYIYDVTDLQDPPRDREAVLQYCQAWIKKSYKRSEMPSWSDPELIGLEQFKETLWRYHVRMAYTG